MLVLCRRCHRHFRGNETACPFCAATVWRAPAAQRLPIPTGASRSQRYALRAAILAGSATASCARTASSTDHDRNGDAGADTTMTGGAGGIDGADGGGGAGNVGGNALVPGRACPGVEERDAAIACRTATDCAPQTGYTAICRGVQQVSPQCAALGLSAPVRECTTNADCGTDWVCRTVNSCLSACVLTAPCNSQNCTGTRSCVDGSCVARPCNVPDGTPCPEHFVCGENGTGQAVCEPQDCTNGYECPPPFECSDPPYLYERGCIGPPCTEDADCACGYCVSSRCAVREGACDYQILMMPYGCVFPDEDWV